MFTYLNPRRSDLFASSFAKQVAWVERDLQKELSHGNLESIRTIIDMRDAMRAYWLAISHCRPGEAYNIGGTVAVKVGDFLDRLIALSSVTIKTRYDPDLLRPADVTLQIPCIDKFSEETGWRPQYSFEESVAHLLEYWRKKADEEVRLKSLV
jgi:nucleoside-diphosphate-sugar epimerase